jgi:hypothetical protein
MYTDWLKRNVIIKKVQNSMFVSFRLLPAASNTVTESDIPRNDSGHKEISFL